MIHAPVRDHRLELVLRIDPPENPSGVMGDIPVTEMNSTGEENIGWSRNFSLHWLPSLCFHPNTGNLSCFIHPRLAILGTRLAIIVLLDCEFLGTLFIGFTLIIRLPPSKRQDRPT